MAEQPETRLRLHHLRRGREGGGQVHEQHAGEGHEEEGDPAEGNQDKAQGGAGGGGRSEGSSHRQAEGRDCCFQVRTDEWRDDPPYCF